MALCLGSLGQVVWEVLPQLSISGCCRLAVCADARAPGFVCCCPLRVLAESRRCWPVNKSCRSVEQLRRDYAGLNEQSSREHTEGRSDSC